MIHNLKFVFLVFCFSAVFLFGQNQRDETRRVDTRIEARSDAQKPPKNLILFVSDGAGPAHFTVARGYAREFLGRGLAIDSIQVGSAETYSSSNRVTDSAAGATAFASGLKTYNGAIGVDEDGKPVATLLEAAERRNMATGLVATSSITHATPASFSSHVANRGDETEIASQQLEQHIEVLFGGGRQFFLPKNQGGVREDGRDLLDETRKRGIPVVLNRAEFDRALKTPVIGLFHDNQMTYEIDRDTQVEPSLAEMTAKAIDLLKDDPDGFFLMVEGSRIDHAAHGHDAAAMLREMLEYDNAVAAALAFARQDQNTLVVAVSDHETGGLTLGRTVEGKGIYDWFPEVLHSVSASQDRIVETIFSEGTDPVEVMKNLAGIGDLNESEKTLLLNAGRGRGALYSTVAEIISRHSALGWTTSGHSAVDVNVYAYGPGREKLIGHHQNSEVGLILARMMGFNLTEMTAQIRKEMEKSVQ